MITGCDAVDERDLSEWMVEQRNTFKPKVKPISEPRKFLPEIYAKNNLDDPFEFKKLSDGISADIDASAKKNSALIDEEMKRRRQPLEAFPLDALFFVGVLQKNKTKIALVKFQSQLHQVSIGDYMGASYGRVLDVNESQIKLRELVQEGGGEWVEKETIVQIQEDKK
jgi:type IV pilus assembly protein PilP